jgi:hypothetical protein
MHIIIQIPSYIEKVSSKETMFLPEMSKNLQISFAAMTHLAEGLFVNSLFTLKVENNNNNKKKKTHFRNLFFLIHHKFHFCLLMLTQDTNFEIF